MKAESRVKLEIACEDMRAIVRGGEVWCFPAGTNDEEINDFMERMW